MSNGFVIIKMCYLQNQWYDISCATLYMFMNLQLIRTLITLMLLSNKCNEQDLQYFIAFN